MRGLPLKFGLLLLGIVLGLVASEIALRVFVEQHRKRLSIYDPELGWRGRPHGTGVYSAPEDEIRSRYRYNNCGFRDEDIVETTGDDLRVVLLGDSFLESLEVAYDDIFPELVESRLQAEVAADSQLIALGAQGYSNAQQLLAYRRYADLLRADVVLTVFYTGNDFEDNQRKQYAYLDSSGQLTFPNRKPPRHKVVYRQARRWLYENSHVVFLAKNLVESRLGWKLQSTTKVKSKESTEYKKKITRQLLMRTRQEVEQRGARFGIVIIPSKKELKSGDPTKIQLVAKWCGEEGIPVLDLSKALSIEHYFKKDPHFNKRGHRVVSDEMFRYLRESFP